MVFAGVGVVWFFGEWLFLGGFRVGIGGIIPYPFMPLTYPTSHFLPLHLSGANDSKTLPFSIHYIKIVEVNRMTITKIIFVTEATPMKGN